MPSNDKLIASIKEIDENFNHEGQSNADMVAVLKWLRLKQSILALDENADVKDKDVNELTAMLEELKPDAEAEAKAKKEKADTEAKAKKEKADTEAKAKKEKEVKKEAKAKQDAIPPYRVVGGKAITCKKGILSDGDEVKAEYLPGGQETLDNLVNRGFVIKK